MFNQQRVVNKMLMPLIMFCGFLLVASASHADNSITELQDPTRPAQYHGKDQADAYRLESILNSPERRVAIINGKVLAVGDTLDAARLRSIGSDSVTLQVANKTIQLKLRSSAVIKEASAR